MGGGDLNLKKSWHPQTLKNIERVWKAEQRHEAERKKIEELQKELREERAREEIQRYAEETGAVKKKDDRLDWMYQGPGGQVSRDEYLLGRPIDKQITQQYEEPDSGPSAQTGLLPGSIFNPPSAANAHDIAAKIREDPLFLIRKREEDRKREVLTNPVKMKKIKEMLQKNLEKKKKKKDKKKKKHKKHRRHSSSEEDSSSDEEQPSRSRRRSTSPSPPSSLPRLPGYGLQLPASRSRQRAASPDQEAAAGRSGLQGPSRSPHRSSSHGTHARGDREQKHRGQSPPPPRHRAHRQHGSSHTKRLSAEELERRRREMMDFARWRDEERAGNVERYREEEEQEKAREAQCGRDDKFIRDMKLQSASTSSLEDRVKRNIYSLQRTPAALERNFMKR
ncbi:pre-mRNA-splicing factor CWC25 homolog [Lepisosteus oculatus]|uniref:pre-mRNA-splicing factor CWC25 homolog n=1 Tax=Lepisosteus oculatus TaxID=7918 RepID=UPI003710DE9A